MSAVAKRGEFRLAGAAERALAPDRSATIRTLAKASCPAVGGDLTAYRRGRER